MRLRVLGVVGAVFALAAEGVAAVSSSWSRRREWRSSVSWARASFWLPPGLRLRGRRALPAVQGKRSLTLTATKTGYAPARRTAAVH